MTHVSLDDLADLIVGEASPDLAAHVADCADCTARRDELAVALGAVAADLAALPAPEVPADVAARLDAVVPPPAPSGTVVPLAAAPSRRTPPWGALGAVAAAAVLVTGGVLLVQHGGGAGSSADKSSSTAGAAPQLPTSSTGTDYRKDGKALALALPQLLAGPTRTEAAPSDAAPTDAKQNAPLAAAMADPLARLRDQTALASCLAGLSDPTSTDLPLALDYAQFEGRPALVVVLPTDKAGKVDVFVVGAQCDQTDQKLLFYTRLSTP